ncbi:single-stranded DNA-binding protein [Candidatus Wolfebacteria bacterium]|nr:single-stranded DNA-binding protein [Candidatus Wolfebacteria bacterium]
MNLNKVFIIGNLTRDPELRSLPSGIPVVSFGVATNRVWKNQQGEKQEEAQFHNIVVFGKQAEIANQYLAKGRMAMIEGRLRTSNWEAQDGTKRSRTEIIAERIQFGPRPVGSGNFNQQSNQKSQENQKADIQSKEELPQIDINEGDIKAEDLPF